ncbi:MAG: UDP-N-acetylmuramoyl-L-alanine--D-glutamate ligase [Spirochaetota bacterium]|nr:UDP-N-acetylmuramoyl-L-alanine--D-glutamate ligase [Spirochaetota bacterium]
MDLNKIDKILVVGLGIRTGLAVSNFLAEKGFSVYASDIKTKEEIQDVIKDLDYRVTVIAGEQGAAILDLGFDLIVLSPGVPRSIPLIKAAQERGIPVIAEIELAYQYLRGGIIAITGTDGKSTTTSLVGHVLNELGVKTFIGGNIGIPLISFVEETDDDSVIVLELSSFQLESIDQFRPDISAILNVTPDHLDRYNGMDDYFRAKLRINMNQMEEDCCIYNIDDEIIVNGLDGIKSRKKGFSLIDTKADAFFENGFLYACINNQKERVIETEKMQILGIHNAANALAALLMILDIMKKNNIEPDMQRIEKAFYTFIGLPHRMERIGMFQGLSFVNDSKATTIGAVEMALKSIHDKCILILGGKPKGDDYTRLIYNMKGRVRHIVLIGETSTEFKSIFKDFPSSISESLDDAIIEAIKHGIKGDVVLLSPGCASFDMFESYEDRGDKFKLSFERLKRGELSWT